jgi:hypothetical protein
LGAAVTVTVPLPVPALLAGTVIQLAPVVAVQAQPPGAVTGTVTLPPSTPTLKLRAVAVLEK